MITMRIGGGMGVSMTTHGDPKNGLKDDKNKTKEADAPEKLHHEGA